MALSVVVVVVVVVVAVEVVKVAVKENSSTASERFTRGPASRCAFRGTNVRACPAWSAS